MSVTHIDYDLAINGVNAKTTYGITLTQDSLSALMTPAPVKSLLTNKVRTASGKSVVSGQTVYTDERDITLTLNLCASTEAEFFSKYSAFCTNVLATGLVNIQTKYQDVIYHFIYVSCSQFSQFMRGIGQFSLKLNEYNPTSRE